MTSAQNISLVSLHSQAKVSLAHTLLAVMQRQKTLQTSACSPWTSAQNLRLVGLHSFIRAGFGSRRIIIEKVESLETQSVRIYVDMNEWKEEKAQSMTSSVSQARIIFSCMSCRSVTTSTKDDESWETVSTCPEKLAVLASERLHPQGKIPVCDFNPKSKTKHRPTESFKKTFGFYEFA